MKRFLIGLGVPLLIIVGGALVLPHLIDWNRHRQQVADFLAEATGRAVTIAGPVDLSLLPKPILTVGEVTFALADQADEVLADIRSVDLRLRPLSLLRGVIQIESLSLVEPRMRLDLLPDGSVRGPIALAALGGTVQIDRLSIEQGELTLRDVARDRTLGVDRVRAEVDAGGPDGPYNVAGGFFLAGLPMSLDVTTGRLAQGGALPVRATLDLPDGGSTVRYAGVVGGGPALMAQGELRAEGTRLAGLAEAVAALSGWTPLAPEAPALAQPFDIRGTLTAERTALSLEGMELRLGETRGGGRAELRRSGADAVAALKLVLSLARLDLDALAAPGDGAPTPGLPADMRLEVDALADQVVWRGGLLRDLRLLAAGTDDRLDLTGLNVVLPGNASLALAGFIAGSAAGEQGRPRADLALEVEADSLRDTLAWLGVDVGRVPVERLRQARLTGRVVGRQRDFQILDAAGTLDTTSFRGALSVSRQGRLGIGLDLQADRLNLDAYGPGLEGADWTALSKAFDANVEARLGQLTLGGVPMDGFALAGTLGGGTLTLRELSADSAAGVKAMVSGRIGGLAPFAASHITVVAEAETLAPLFRALGREPPVPPDRLGPVRLNARMAGDAARVALEAEAGFRGGTLQAGGAVSTPLDTPALTLKLRGTFPETADLVRLVAPDRARTRVGPFDVYAELIGPPSRLEVRAIQGTIGDTGLRGEATLDRTGARPVLQASLQADTLDLDLLAPALAGGAEAPWSLDWTGGVDLSLALQAETMAVAGESLRDASLTATAGPGIVAIADLQGRWRGGEVSGGGKLELPPAAPDGPVEAVGSAELRLVGATWPDSPADGGGPRLSGSRVDLELAGRGTGTTPGALLAGMTGTLDLTAADGALAGVNLDRLATALAQAKTVKEAQAALSDSIGRGRTPLTGLKGRFTLKGRTLVTDDLRAETPGGVVSAKGTLDYAADSLDMALLIDPARPEAAPDVAATLSGPMAKPDRTFAADALLDWVRARAALAKPAARPPPGPDPAPPAPLPKQDRPESRPVPRAEPATRPPQPAPTSPAATPQPQAGNDAVRGILDRLKQ